MQLDKDTLLKHRFWILLGVVVPLIIIVLVLVPAIVGSATEKMKSDVENTKKSLSLSDPKNPKWIDSLNEKDKKLADKRDEVWNSAWLSQANLYTWPDDPELRQYTGAYFGAPIDRHACGKYAGKLFNLDQARKIYDIVQPVNARGDGVVLVPRGPNIISTIPKFRSGEPPAEELWLAQEDLWVQRELLQVVRDANDSVAVFKVLPNFAAMAVVGPGVYKGVPEERYWPAAGKLEVRQRFYNANWELELVLGRNAKNEQVLRGKLTNLSRRMLPLGIQFNVQLKRTRPEGDVGVYHMMVDGESLAAGKSVNLKETSSLAQQAPDGLFGVVQQFTWKTAPVKRLDALALYRQSHRTANAKLQPPRQFPQTAADKPPDPATARGGVEDTGPAIAVVGPGGPGAPVSGPMTVSVTPSGLVRDRYIHVTEQVRRMPVALTVVCEQAHIPNVIAAFSNSKLRMQVTQVHMTHVRDPLRAPGEGAPSPGGPDDAGTPGRPGFPGRLPGGGRGGDDTGSPDYTGPVPGRPGMPLLGTPGQIAPGQPPVPGAGLFPDVGGEQGAGNLVEVTVYAIASLYEKFPPPKAPAGDATAGKPATETTSP